MSEYKLVLSEEVRLNPGSPQRVQAVEEMSGGNTGPRTITFLPWRAGGLSLSCWEMAVKGVVVLCTRKESEQVEVVLLNVGRNPVQIDRGSTLAEVGGAWDRSVPVSKVTEVREEVAE